MVVHEIRETIETRAQSGDDNSMVQVQKKINLKQGKRHNILHMDFFDDNFTGAFNATETQVIQVYVSNYPIVLTAGVVGQSLASRGPLAGDDQVLFKYERLSLLPGRNGGYDVQEFPNTFLGSSPTFTFYTDHVYLTVIFYTDSGPIDMDFAMSFYMSVDSVDVDSVEYGIGVLREYAEAQARIRVSNGVTIEQSEIRGGLPMWGIGGVRPEIMTGTGVSGFGNEWFFNTNGYGGAENMSDTFDIRLGTSQARTMVPNVDAFGDATIDAPDWFKGVVRPFPSLSIGPVRPQQPPLKHFDNGNVEML